MLELFHHRPAHIFKHMKKLHLILTVGASALLASSAFAGSGKVEVVDPYNFCDDTWKTGFGTNPVLENFGPIDSLSWIGRYHGQYHNTESDQGDDSDWENRRFRFGVEIEFLDDFTFTGQFNLKRDFDQGGRFVDSVEDLTIEWDPEGAAWDLSVGKQKTYLSREWNTSSKRIKTMERSQLVNQIVPDKLGGVILGLDELGPLESVKLGVFAGGHDDDWSYPTMEGVGANFSATYGLSEITELRFDYLYTDNDSAANAFEGYDHAFSLNSLSEINDRLSLVTDIIYGVGDDSHSDVFGVVIMPYYNITDDLEFVFRYTYSNADDADGLNVQSRYERRAGGRLQGDEYHAFYLGLNYYICGDRLKLMGGVEFSDLDGQDENDYTTFWSGVRLYF